MTTAPEVLQLRGICKSFPGVRALEDVDFSVAAGEVHGLVGENGAGKSTLIKIISGVYQRDSGEMLVNGDACGNLTPRQVEDLGIQFIYQEQNLVPEFTVAQSIFMGQEKRLGKWVPLVDNRGMERESSQLIARHARVWTCPATGSSAISRWPNASSSRSPRPSAPSRPSWPSMNPPLPWPAARSSGSSP